MITFILCSIVYLIIGNGTWNMVNTISICANFKYVKFMKPSAILGWPLFLIYMGMKMREPDYVIGDNYLHRWWLMPRNRYFNVYLHKIMHDNDPRALHDHPWWSVSVLLKGELLEVHAKGQRKPVKFLPLVRSAKFAHRLKIVKGPAWTLFITGPVIREWGFHCPKKWTPWKEFVDSKDAGQIGVGCGEE